MTNPHKALEAAARAASVACYGADRWENLTPGERDLWVRDVTAAIRALEVE